MQKTVGLALEQNATPIEVEILKSSAKRSVFKAAAGQNWKTRHVRVKDNEFQVLKSGSVIQSCPIRNGTVKSLAPRISVFTSERTGKSSSSNACKLSLLDASMRKLCACAP